MRSACLIIFLAIFCAQSTWAGRAPDYTIHQEYTSTRALGMGNAFTAVVDDHSALFYNPAALALRNDTQVRLFLRAGADADVIGFKNDINDAGSDAVAMNAALEKHYGEHMYFRAPTIGTIIARPKWSMAILPIDFSVDLALHRSLAASVFVNAYLDTTIAYGRAKKYNWFGKKHPIAVGWNAKAINRLFYSDVIQSAQLANDESLVNMNRSAEGATLDGDLGILYQFRTDEDVVFKPTLGVVIRNVLDYGFTTNLKILEDSVGEPPRLQRRLDIGAKVDLPKFWVFDPKVAIDERDIGHRNWSPLKGFHAGAELYWKMYNWWKGHWSAGINQGYWTAGFGARLAFFQIDIASWGEEVGTSDSRRESRRYILETSLDF